MISDAFDLFKSGYSSILYDEDSVIRDSFSQLKNVDRLTGTQLIEAGKLSARRAIMPHCEISEKTNHSFKRDEHRRNYGRLDHQRITRHSGN